MAKKANICKTVKLTRKRVVEDKGKQKVRFLRFLALAHGSYKGKDGLEEIEKAL